MQEELSGLVSAVEQMARAVSKPLTLAILALLLAPATPARAQNVNPPDFCPQAAALVRYFASARDQGEVEISALLHVDYLLYDATGIAAVRGAVKELYAGPRLSGAEAAAEFERSCLAGSPRS